MSLHIESSWSRGRDGGKPWNGKITILSVTFTKARPWGRWRRKVYLPLVTSQEVYLPAGSQLQADAPAKGGAPAGE